MSARSSVLFVIDRGGYPLFADALQESGYEVLVASSTRKALNTLKSFSPDVIVVEFNYGPRYGVLISNMEPLLAVVQSRHPETRVIALLEKEHEAQLDRLRAQYTIHAGLHFPLQRAVVLRCIDEAIQARREPPS